MSKQQEEVGRLLRALFKDVEEEKGLEKVTNNIFHKGIRLDFWIPSANLVVEVHGVQHYKPSGFGRDKVATLQAFSSQVDRDNKLRNICKTSNINYMEIPHDYNISFKDFFPYLGQNNE